MKKIHVILFALIGIILILINSCQIKPYAQFEVLKNNYNHYVVGKNIKFTNQSYNYENCIWYFGDGETSSLDTPTHVYDYPGTYQISLIVYSSNGKRLDNYYQTITVIANQGNAIFWMSEGEYINNVTLNNSTKSITRNLTVRPNCSTDGCACFNNLSSGTYNYTATDGNSNWNGNITIIAGECSTMHLFFNKATIATKRCQTKMKDN